MALFPEATLTSSIAEELARRIQYRTARTAVIGMGYVGLPLAVELARAGFSVTAIEKDPEKVERLQACESYIDDVDSGLLAKLVSPGRLTATLDASVLADVETVSICVPTPLRKTKDPDMAYVLAAVEELARHLHRGMLVILESTTYPGTTEELVLPILEQSGLTVGEDFFLCFSPERVDPGNPQYKTRNIPKVIGGVTSECTRMGAIFYGEVMERVVEVSSSRVAEMVKLLENTFRMINIGLANEMALMCGRMKIDVWEVIEAAATKPFGFMPFYPGPGLGGHCIPVDPHYLSWKTKQEGMEARFIDLAAQVNREMPYFVFDKIRGALNDHGKPVKGSHIHVIGVAYKPNVADVRESPALDIIALIEKCGGRVTYTDPYIPRLAMGSETLESQPAEPAVREADCVVIVTDHDSFDYQRLAEDSRLIVDTRNRLKGIVSSKIVRL